MLGTACCGWTALGTFVFCPTPDKGRVVCMLLLCLILNSTAETQSLLMRRAWRAWSSQEDAAA